MGRIISYVGLTDAVIEAGLEVVKTENNRLNVGRTSMFVLFETVDKLIKSYKSSARRDSARWQQFGNACDDGDLHLVHRITGETIDFARLTVIMDERVKMYHRKAKRHLMTNTPPLNARQKKCLLQIGKEWADPPKYVVTVTLLSLCKRGLIEMRPLSPRQALGAYNTPAWQYRLKPEIAK